MRKLGFVVIALGVIAILAAQTKDAWAGCPPGTSYKCYQSMNGKVICGCQ